MQFYSKEIRDYVSVKIETCDSDCTIARDIQKKFSIDKEIDPLRNFISRVRASIKKLKLNKKKRRLFFDIETTYMLARVWSCGKQYVGPERLLNETTIICISYKWEGEEKVNTLVYKRGCDKKIVKEFCKIMGEADEIIAHNGDNFDEKILRARCVKHGILMYPHYRTLDTLKKARQYFRFPSNKLDYIGKFLNVGEKMHHQGFQMWIDIVENKCKKALEQMVKYCEQDVLLLEDVYTTLAPYIYHNTNFAVLHGGEKWECPECTGKDVNMYRTYTTPMGIVRRNMRCRDCNKQYKISNRTYMAMLVSNNIL